MNFSWFIEYPDQSFSLFSSLCTCEVRDNMYINQRDAKLLMNDLYHPLIGSTYFGLSPDHHQEHRLINCITHWYVRAGESSCCVDVGRTGMFVQASLAVAWM